MLSHPWILNSSNMSVGWRGRNLVALHSIRGRCNSSLQTQVNLFSEIEVEKN